MRFEFKSAYLDHVFTSHCSEESHLMFARFTHHALILRARCLFLLHKPAEHSCLPPADAPTTPKARPSFHPSRLFSIAPLCSQYYASHVCLPCAPCAADILPVVRQWELQTADFTADTQPEALNMSECIQDTTSI